MKAKSKLNKDRHETHRMPKNPTKTADRVAYRASEALFVPYHTGKTQRGNSKSGRPNN